MFRSKYQPYFIGMLLCLILVIAPNKVVYSAGAPTPPQEDTTSIAGPDTVQRELPWALLDTIRLAHLAGESEEALVLLERLAADTMAVSDGAYIRARQELTAFVLAALGEHQRAFDTLHASTTTRLEEMQLAHATAQAQAEAELARLQAQLNEERATAETTAREREQELITYLFVAGGTGIFLFVCTLVLAMVPRRKKRSDPLERAQPATPAPEPPPPPRKLAEIQKQGVGTAPAKATGAGPMDVAVMHDHTRHLIQLLHKNATIEAAGYVGIFDRFLKLLQEHVQEGFIAVQDALPLIRQYIKLETLRQEAKFSYSVDTDRKLKADLRIPIMPVLTLLHQVLGSINDRRDPTLSVELVPSAVGEGIQCIIKFPPPAIEDEELTKLKLRSKMGAVHQEKSEDGVLLRLELPVAQ